MGKKRFFWNSKTKHAKDNLTVELQLLLVEWGMVYVTADDFGGDAGVNAAVKLAHEKGVLGGASLMVSGSAWREAVALARGLPGLAVGLHLVVSEGRPVLPAERIRRLVDGAGHFLRSPARAGWRYWRSGGARKELAMEIEAQFARFGETGLALSHVDGHQHMHMHPVVFDIMLPLAQRWGARRIRVVRDDLSLAARFDGGGWMRKAAAAWTFGALEWRARRRLAGTGIAAADRTYGFLRSGRMEEGYVVAALERAGEESIEIYFHPSMDEWSTALGPNRGDLETLLSGRVRAALMRNHAAGEAARGV